MLDTPHKSKEEEGASLMIVISWSKISIRAQDDDCVEDCCGCLFPGGV